MEIITIRTGRDRSWPLFKLIDKYGKEVEAIRIYDEDIEIRFRVKKILFSEKLGRKIFLSKARRAVC
ncbi:MAG: hypothetical protein J6Y02_20315 [Pseudobutyrivibrio sp.]|nr:hypothetical protein [Pseudobutyrivibrio sp.]